MFSEDRANVSLRYGQCFNNIWSMYLKDITYISKKLFMAYTQDNTDNISPKYRQYRATIICLVIILLGFSKLIKWNRKRSMSKQIPVMV